MFITLEGIDGSGKTTLIKKIEFYLKTKGYKFLITREPGGSEISESIREVILKDFPNDEMEPWTEALLYIAARKQHFEKIIKPNLKKGIIIISDRFSDSTLVYQGFARGLSVESLIKIQSIVFNDVKPNITFFLDCSPETLTKRIKTKSEKEVNRFDLESLEFHKKVYEGYLNLLEKDKKRFRVISSEKTADEVFLQCKEIMDKEIKINK
ncbi:dTMP kinase [Spiroplasma endosymbiont of Amphibalanus improvisus]|uniref:dTMP kinase n=1 Tax=Spiroplasma endosymbiont of Amphibalanus improvisus TaxID=3066327 RepID=UPI00313CC04E